MAKKDPFELGKDSRGNYKRAIGWKPDGEGGYVTHTFYLGADRGAACVASMNLEKCWQAVYDKWHMRRETPRAAWDETTLTVAKAVAAGKTRIEVVYPLSLDFNLLHWGEQADTELQHWLHGLRTMFPFVQIDLEDAALQEKVSFTLDRAEEHHEKKAEFLKRIKGKSSGKTLTEALDAYAADVPERYRRPEGGVTAFGRTLLRRVACLREHLADKVNTPLSGITTAFLDRWVHYWQGRPTGAKKKPLSPYWCKDTIKTIRDFVRWLNRRQDEFAWKKPADYEVLPARVKRTHEEKATSRGTKKRYTRDELAVLWEYALPVERLYIALGLNCAFGVGEIETLTLKEIDLERGLIKDFVRVKTGVAGEWQLWPETVAGLRWYLAQRPKSDSPFVFVKEGGRPYLTPTAGDNKGQTIPNAWDRLFHRIRKDHPEFPKLSFNKLRKTGPHWIRRRYSDELADMMLCHAASGMVDHYTGRPLQRLFRALKHYRRALAPVFATVADPYTLTVPKKAVLSRGQIKKIQETYREKKTVVATAAALGLGRETVRKYLKVKL